MAIFEQFQIRWSKSVAVIYSSEDLSPKQQHSHSLWFKASFFSPRSLFTFISPGYYGGDSTWACLHIPVPPWVTVDSGGHRSLVWGAESFHHVWIGQCTMGEKPLIVPVCHGEDKSGPAVVTWFEGSCNLFSSALLWSHYGSSATCHWLFGCRDWN